MKLIGLILKTAIKEAGEFGDVRLKKEDAEYLYEALTGTKVDEAEQETEE